MSTNPNAEKAVEVLRGKWDYFRRIMTWHEISDALDSAGLLITPLHERALKACEGLHEVDGRENKTIGAAYGFQASLNEARSVGFESLAAKAAAKKAKEPVSYARGWMTVGPINGGWQVVPPQGGVISISATLTEPQARAVAVALNALEVAK